MSTRSHVAFYEEVDQNLERPTALLYRHSDGYPQGMLPDLLPILVNFNDSRGLSDISYAAARVIQWLANASDEHTARWRSEGEADYLGYGVDYERVIHGDVEYIYAVYPMDGTDTETLTGRLTKSAAWTLKVFEAEYDDGETSWTEIMDIPLNNPKAVEDALATLDEE